MKTARYLAADSGIDPKFFNQVAQFAHFGMMFTVTTFASHFGHKGRWVGLALCILYAAIHEFVWDPKMENAETRGSDLEDFIFLVAGSCVAVVLSLY
jgi:hypothetical protein